MSNTIFSKDWNIAGLCSKDKRDWKAVIGSRRKKISKRNRSWRTFDRKMTVWLAIGLGLAALGAAPASAGLVKICKVAGPGVTVGTDFTFDVSGASDVTVPAGPAPGGYCWFANRQYDDDDQVAITEIAPPGYSVIGIRVEPFDRQVGAIDLPGKRVTIDTGSGITEVTYTNERKFGYVEICKTGNVRGNFSFTVQPGNLGPFVVPAGACSPAIEVPAGEVTIHELLDTSEPAMPPTFMSGCSTIPAGRQGNCDTNSRTSVVTVLAGDISMQTIAFIDNRSNLASPGGSSGNDGQLGPARRRSDTGKTVETYVLANNQEGNWVIGDIPAATTIDCAPSSSPVSGLWSCTAKVNAASAKAGAPTGMVRFVSGDEILSVIPLKTNGTATLAIPRERLGGEAIMAAYSGDRTFDAGASKLFNISGMRGAGNRLVHGLSTFSSDITPAETLGDDAKIYHPGEKAPNDGVADTLNRKETVRVFGSDVELDHSNDESIENP